MTAESTRKKPTQKAIRRAVASSTAIETSQPIAELERKLKSSSSKHRKVELAD